MEWGLFTLRYDITAAEDLINHEPKRHRHNPLKLSK